MKKTFRSKLILLNTISVVIALLISSLYLLTSFSKITRINAINEAETSIKVKIEKYRGDIDDLYNLSYSLIAVSDIRDWFDNNITISSNQRENAEFIKHLKNETDGILMFNNTWKSKIVNNIGLFTDNYNTLLAQRIPSDFIDIRSSLEAVYRETKDLPNSSFFYKNGLEIYFLQRVYNNTFDNSITYIYEINNDIFLNELTKLSPEITLKILFDGDPIYNYEAVENSSGLSVRILNKIFPNVGFSVSRNIENTPLSFEIAVSNSYINKPIVSALKKILIVSLLILILITTAVALLTKSATKFIDYLINAINEIKTHKMGNTLKRNKNTDLNEIVDAFNSMSLELQTLIDKGYKRDVLLLQSNIRQLQAQMNPHFLINSLASISTYALLNGDEKTYEMIIALTTILNQSMFNTKDSPALIELKEEMDNLSCYLKIQKFRFEDKIKINIDVDEELYHMGVPRLSIEPLVENAVIHGVEDSIEMGIINISIKRQDNKIITIVSDNGKALERDDRNKIKAVKSHHISINNTNSRIHLLFGEEYGIKYNFDKENITEAILILPVVEDINKPSEEINKCTK